MDAEWPDIGLPSGTSITSEADGVVTYLQWYLSDVSDAGLLLEEGVFPLDGEQDEQASPTNVADVDTTVLLASPAGRLRDAGVVFGDEF